MRIALFTDSFVPGVGGTEKVVLKLATLLSAEHSVMVVAPEYHTRFDDSALPFKVVRAPSIKLTKNDNLTFPNATKRVKRAVDEFAPQIIHAHTLSKVAGFAVDYAKKNNIPSICTVHTKYKYCIEQYTKNSFFVNLYLKSLIKVANSAREITAVCNSMVNELHSYGLSREVRVIKNGNDLHQKSVCKNKDNLKFTLAYVGRLESCKNLLFSLKCLVELKKNTSDFIFYMVGSGSYKRVLKRFIAKHGLKDNVVLTGVLEKEQINQIYDNSNLLLFTSVFDNDSLVIIEAAERCVPALVLEGTGSAERIQNDKTGFVVGANQKQVANKIYSLMQDRKLLERVGQNAIQICIPWQDILNEYLALYNQLTKDKK